MATLYEGTGDSIGAAVQQAHMQIPPSEGRGFTVSKVIEWGMQHGGFIANSLYYAVVEKDPDALLGTSQSDPGN